MERFLCPLVLTSIWERTHKKIKKYLERRGQFETTCYKILSKALAARLREATEQLDHRDQTYCAPGRSTVDDIYQIQDVLAVSPFLLGLNTGLNASDQEKACDRAEHRFVLTTTVRVGVTAGPGVVQWYWECAED